MIKQSALLLLTLVWLGGFNATAAATKPFEAKWEMVNMDTPYLTIPDAKMNEIATVFKFGLE